MIRMTAFFKPLAFSLCGDCAKIAAGIPSAINVQNTSLSLIYRCQMGQSQGQRERNLTQHQLP
jgi:hypothetical protein